MKRRQNHRLSTTEPHVLQNSFEPKNAFPIPFILKLSPADIGAVAVIHALQNPGCETLLRHTIEQKMPNLSRTPRPKMRRWQL
jgi:hypothetical protein